MSSLDKIAIPLDLCPLACAALMSCALAAGCAPVVARGPLDPQITRRGINAFHVLAQVGYQYRALACGPYPQSSPAEAHVIVEPRAYAALYENWKLCGPPPAVDFRRHVVVAFLRHSAGCEAELVGFELSADGHLSPRVELHSDMCNEVLISHRFVAAIPRSALPPGGVHLDVEDASDWARWPYRSMRPTAAPNAIDPRSSGAPIAEIAIPPPGRAQLQQLADGALVWIVHGQGGEHSAVSAWTRSPERPEAPDQTNVAGLYFPVTWAPDVGRFYSAFSFYDPHGVNVMGGNLPGLDAYAVQRVGEALTLFGPAAPASGPQVSDPASYPGPALGIEAFAQLLPERASSLEQALYAPPGTALKIDADVVRIGADPRVVLCEVERTARDRYERCRRDGAWIEDARIVPGVENPYADGGVAPDRLGAHPEVAVILSGPVLAYRTEAGFARVHLLRPLLNSEQIPATAATPQ